MGVVHQNPFRFFLRNLSDGNSSDVCFHGVFHWPVPWPGYQQFLKIWGTTVDGSEILRSPVEVGSLSHYLQGFSTIPGGCLGFLNHQQYFLVFYTKRETNMFAP